MIDKTIREKTNLQPYTHEPCLYSGYMDGKKVLFLRQVDDFAVAFEDPEISNKVIDLISAELSALMKKLGAASRYNGTDVTQAEDFIKIHNTTYIKNILETHEWLQEPCKIPQNPIPMKEDNSYLTIQDMAKGPNEQLQNFQLENEMGFSYLQVIGKLMFAMVTCRPDISFPMIKLSTYFNNPAREHYQAVKQVMRYLRATMNDGITYWRQKPRKHSMLQIPTQPILFHQQNPEPPNPRPNESTLIDSVDSDWASDYTTRKSISGIVIYLVGGTIHYKTQQQGRVVLSSCEAEFVADCAAAKVAIHLRSLLFDIDIPQEHATMIYEDNTGALTMAKTSQPTERTKQIDAKHFAIQDWVEQDLVVPEQEKISQ